VSGSALFDLATTLHKFENRAVDAHEYLQKGNVCAHCCLSVDIFVALFPPLNPASRTLPSPLCLVFWPSGLALCGTWDFHLWRALSANLAKLGLASDAEAVWDKSREVQAAFASPQQVRIGDANLLV